MQNEYFDWLEPWRVPDHALAQAYNTVSALQRAQLKTALAFQFELCQRVQPDLVSHSQHNARTGFDVSVEKRPLPWALAVVDSAFASPARLLAALTPALLAGVPQVLVAFIKNSAQPIPAAILVALELAGLEDLFELSEEQCRMLLSKCMEQNPLSVGCLLLFPTQSKSEFFVDLRTRARQARLPLWQDRGKPRIALLHNAPLGAEKLEQYTELLLAAHPDANIQAVPSTHMLFSGAQPAFGPRMHVLQALFNAGPQPEPPQPLWQYSPVVLSPGLEMCWIHTHLDKEFYHKCAWAVSGTFMPPSTPE